MRVFHVGPASGHAPGAVWLLMDSLLVVVSAGVFTREFAAALRLGFLLCRKLYAKHSVWVMCHEVGFSLLQEALSKTLTLGLFS